MGIAPRIPKMIPAIAIPLGLLNSPMNENNEPKIQRMKPGMRPMKVIPSTRAIRLMMNPAFAMVLLSLTYTYFVPFSSFTIFFFDIILVDLEIIGFLLYVMLVF